MKPSEYDAGHYLESDVRLKVPPYQRPYEWNSDRWTDLWRDVTHQYRQIGAGKATSPSHYMGALILEADEPPANSPVHSFWAIDGQQRILTMFVLMAALRDQEAFVAGSTVPKVNDLNTITPRYGSPCDRLIVREQNRPEMKAILQGDFVQAITASHMSTRLAQAYRFFRWQLWLGRDGIRGSRVSEPPRPKKGKGAPPLGSYDDWPPGAPARKQLSIMDLHTVITKRLRLLELLLEKTDEESSVIFETMNSKSTPLRQFDLVRNSIFVRMPTRRDAFYAATWQPVENVLTSVSYSSLRAEPEEQFLYEHLISLGEDKISRDSMHRRWVTRVIDTVGYAVTKQSEKQFEERIARPMATSAALYPLAVGQQKKVSLAGVDHTVTDEQHLVIREIMAMTGGPAVPLILQVLEDAHGASAPVDAGNALRMLRDIQSFVVRLILAGETLSPLRATLMGVASSVPRPLSLQGLRNALHDAGWLTDKEVLTAVKEVSLREVGSASYFPILRGIERHLAGAGAHPMPFGSSNTEYSVEHIYPQTENIGAAWNLELQTASVNRDDMDARRHVLGNLTAVTGYDNKKNGKKPFAQKVQLIVKVAPLRLHDSITNQKSWTPKVIDARTELLARAALAEWPAP